MRNDLVYSRIATELAECIYKRMVDQCRAKIKVLKYKQIADKLRRSGAGRESDEKSQESLEFPYFTLLKKVEDEELVTPVNLVT